ncbi:elicitor-responsive protein 1 [Salvia miltiorrhiza]|uniref:elicitor-responsive protein 1 n=1 Tax=Salvia miltiorrhiza TaxID=226208 RepID=UPI0025AB9DFE|nr:elicitor-responsive protein 1 [Salvia miltiorrhiza]
MGEGIMEVKLIGAKGLKRSNFFGKIDPYVVIQYRNEEYTSTTAKGQGRRLVWNEEFKFKVEFPALDGSDDYQNNYKLFLRIFNRDTCRKDDFLGHSTIHVKDLIEIGLEKGKADLGTQKFRVILNDLSYHGEIQVAITFTAKGETDQPKYFVEKENIFVVF